MQFCDCGLGQGIRKRKEERERARRSAPSTRAIMNLHSQHLNLPFRSPFHITKKKAGSLAIECDRLEILSRGLEGCGCLEAHR